MIGNNSRRTDFGIVEVVYPKKNYDTPILLGRTPFFDEFQVIFEKFDDKIHLIPNTK